MTHNYQILENFVILDLEKIVVKVNVHKSVTWLKDNVLVVRIFATSKAFSILLISKWTQYMNPQGSQSLIIHSC